jgi:hypothetical protein
MERGSFVHILLSVVVALLVLGLAYPGHALDRKDIEIGGYFRNETSIRVRDPYEFLWTENIFQLDVNTRLVPEKFYFYFSGRLYYDAVYDVKQSYGFVSNGTDRRALRKKMATNHHGSQADYIRECYLDIFTDHFDIRLGKQQIVWGETEGFKMLDIVNPQDIRHFNQDNFEDSRITLWAAKIDWNPTLDTQLELVVIPDWEPLFAAPFFHNHPFTPLALRTAPPFPLVEHEVGQNVSNTEWGVRWFQNFGSFNYTLNYFRHWTDTPGGYLNLRRFRLDLKYKRVHSLGASFSWNFTEFLGLKHVVLRGETVLNLGDLQPALNFARGGLPETVRSDNWNYALALDKTFWRPYRLWPSGLSCTFQLFQSHILDYEHSKTKRHYIVPQTNAHADRWETVLIAVVTTAYLPGEYLKPQMLVAYKDDGDWWIAPGVTYEFTERITAFLGAHLYSGPFDGLIGEFQKSSNVLLRVKYGF